MITMNPLSAPLEKALFESEQKRNRVYQADDILLPLPELIERAQITDAGGYADAWEKYFSLRQDGTYSFRHYRFRFIDMEEFQIETREMLRRNKIHPTRDQVSLLEFIKMVVWHRKVMLHYMKQGCIFTAIGQDKFRLSFGTYPELRLDDSGVPTLFQRRLYPGSWSRNHVLVMRATLA